MKSLFLSTLALAALVGTTRAQAQDVGLTMDGGMLTVIFGQDCGPVSCTPMFGGVVGAGQPRNLMHYGAPQTFYAIAIGLPGTCLQIPGLDNPFLLQDAIVLGFGLTSSPPFVPTPCQQGVAGETFTLPANTPPGILFRVQSLGVSPQSGRLAFGPAIEAVTG